MCRRLEQNQPGSADYPKLQTVVLLACVAEAAGTALCTGGVVICLLLAAGSLQVDCLSLTLECPVIWCWYTCELRTL